MKNQIKMDLTPIPKIKVEKKTISQTWKKKLQEYCDQQSQTEGPFTGYCICGEMSYCDLCDGVDMNLPCARAILKLAKSKNIKINDKDYDFKSLIKKI